MPINSIIPNRNPITRTPTRVHRLTTMRHHLIPDLSSIADRSSMADHSSMADRSMVERSTVILIAIGELARKEERASRNRVPFYFYAFPGPTAGSGTTVSVTPFPQVRVKYIGGGAWRLSVRRS
jgi:hypothetical protein